MTFRYAELQCVSNYSFLEGASHASELVGQAALLGLSAIGIADRNSVAGVVRAHIAARETGMRLLAGARLDLMDGASLIAWPRDRAAWGRLCRLSRWAAAARQRGLVNSIAGTSWTMGRAWP